MKALNVIKKFQSIAFTIGLLIVGLIIAGIAGFMYAQPSKETVPVNATILSIDEFGTSEDKEYHVTVSYEVDGVTYTNELGSYDSRWDIGDVIEIRYEVGNPDHIMDGDGKLIVLVVLIVGLIAFISGVVMTIKNVRKPAKDYAQYDRVDESSIDPIKKEEIESNNEPLKNYVFHFTGKMNQSFTMKDEDENEVYRCNSGSIKLVGATDFEFYNPENGNKSLKKIGHTMTTTTDSYLIPNVKSSFKIDGVDCWDYLAKMGYGFDFSLKGIKCHFDVRHYGVPVGSIETAGTEVMNEKYEGNALAKLPTNGIYRISCKPSEVEGFFYICFAITRTEISLS